MPKAVRIGSGELLHVARPLLGCALEKDGGRAGAADKLLKASLRREGVAGRDFHGEQALRQSKQPAGAGLPPRQTEQIHDVPRREQSLRLGNEQAPADKGFQMETVAALRGRNHGEKRKRKEGMDS